MANAPDLSLRGRFAPMAISPARSGQCRGADSRARRRTCNLYKPPSKWQTLPTCHCEEANGRRGNLGKAVAFSPMAFPRCDCVLRDCHVASLLAMTHQVVRRCTSALLPLNGSVQGGHYPQGARRIRKAAKPPTAAQGAPLQTQLVRAVFTTAGPNRQYAARPGCPLPLQRTAGGQRMIHSSFSTRSVRPARHIPYLQPGDFGVK